MTSVSKNNYQNIWIIIFCLVLCEWLTPYLKSYTYNLRELLSVYFIALLVANLLVISPILIGNALLKDNKSYWQRFQIKGNVLVGLIVGILTFTAIYLFLKIVFPIGYYEELFDRFLEMFVIDNTIELFINSFFKSCLLIFFFRRIKQYTQWEIWRITLLYTGIYIAAQWLNFPEYGFSEPFSRLLSNYQNYLIVFVYNGILIFLYFWIYKEWKYNFWVIVFVNILMIAFDRYILWRGEIPNYKSLIINALPIALATIITAGYKAFYLFFPIKKRP
ncbi:hypothetical protein [Capnocytophaga sputigena]|uniref:hypothetical protein n=1 Tax=Capnocytophaga sputigena TaxID=1019 RepID=UPI0028E8F25F|nr:hypothetical protein [Capnocytophaga sputigena]